jgi:putative ABC transport system permease protein
MTRIEQSGYAVFGESTRLGLPGREVVAHDVFVLVFVCVIAALAAALLYLFFRTHLGTAMQAAGDGPQMMRTLGVRVDNMIVLGLTMANMLAACAGSLFAQYQGFADVQMGIGMVVWGLGSYIIGAALVGTRQLEYLIAGTIMGSILFRLIVALALRAGFNPMDLRLITAALVLLALIAPTVMARLRARTA